MKSVQQYLRYLTPYQSADIRGWDEVIIALENQVIFQATVSVQWQVVYNVGNHTRHVIEPIQIGIREELNERKL